MNHSNKKNYCQSTTYYNPIPKNNAIWDKQYDANSFANGSAYLLKIGAASSLVLTLCNVEFNSSNYAYSETIIKQDSNRIDLNIFKGLKPLNIEFEEDHDIAFEATLLENLSSVPPKKTFKLQGKVNIIKKGTPSKV